MNEREIVMTHAKSLALALAGVRAGAGALAPLAAVLAAALATPASAQMAAMAETPPACPAVPAALPPQLAAFRTPQTIAAGDGSAKAAAPTLVAGKAATLTLAARRTVTFPIELSHAQPDGYAGTAEIVVDASGTYRFAMSAGAWIEVAGAAALVPSVAHGHGPDCSGIRKMVDFALTPGRYTIEIAGSPDPRITVLAVRQP